MDEDRAARVVESLATTELMATGPALPADVWPVEKYGFRFGTEVEIYMKPLNDKVHRNWSGVAEGVGEVSQSSCIPAVVGKKDSGLASCSGPNGQGPPR